MRNPNQILETLYAQTVKNLEASYVKHEDLQAKIEFICRCHTNKAPIRFLLACLLAKMHQPDIDIRKPYTEIGGEDSYSGRTYDEGFIQTFVNAYKLPCNATTAFLTPAFRNIDRLLTTDLVLVGNPRTAYNYTLELLDAIHHKRINAKSLFQEILRLLLIIKRDNETRMTQLIADLKHAEGILPLSSEQIVTLLQQHLNCKNSSRLPVLMVTAAYLTVQNHIGETVLPLQSHTAADKQTGALGDVEITLMNDEKIVTCYEMKNKKVTLSDIDLALQKIANSKVSIDNYIFITTDLIEVEVAEYSKSIYDHSGVEVAVLGCLGFVRHYLHFFHRYRTKFLDTYQELVLNEPTSSVSQPLKEAFLVLRKTAESE